MAKMRHESADSIGASGLRPAWAGYKTAACICSTEQQTLASRRRPYKDHGARDSPRSSRVRPGKKMDSALALAAGGRPVKLVCEVL
ncbi:transposase, partial [Burkholderia cenocepacia]